MRGGYLPLKMGRVCSVMLITAMLVGVVSPLASALIIPPGTQQYTINPTFRIVLLTPEPNPTRQQWALAIQSNLKEFGIQADLVVADWDVVCARSLLPDINTVGKTYDQGGFDAVFLDRAVKPDPNPYLFFHSSQYPPYGQNYYSWNNSLADSVALNITRELNFATRMTLLKQWQAINYEQLPQITICYNKETVVFAKNVNGTPFTLYYYPLWCPAEQWRFLDNSTSMVIAQTGPAPTESLSLFHTTSYYDLTACGSIFGEGGGWGATMRNATFIPQLYLADQITHTPDYLNWTIHVRPGISYQDGTSVDGRDLVATLRAALSPAWGSTMYAYIKSILGTDAEGYGNRSIFYWGETGTKGAGLPLDYYTVNITIPKPWVYFDSDILGAVFYPANLLVNQSSYDWSGQDFLQPDAATLQGFKETSFSKGTTVAYKYYGKNSTQISGVGPFGLGPYKYVGIDSKTETVKLQKWEGYWNKAALEATGAYNITDFWVQHISTSSNAIADLKDGKVQVLDSQYQLQKDASQLDPAWSGNVSYVAWHVQELGFNMRHPILGTGINTPLGQAYPARAAEAALHVRRAIECLTPKDYIVKTLLAGYGSAGLTTSVLPQMSGGAAYNSAISVRNITDTTLAKYTAMEELKAAGYNFVPVTPMSFFDAYGLLLSAVELGVVAILAGYIIHRLRPPIERV